MAQRQAQPNLPAEEKEKKPKPILQVTFTVRDDSKIASDFWVWDEDELGRRKKWTVSGEEAVKFLYARQPTNVRILAALFNVQVALAGYPDQQGPWVTVDRGGKMVGHINPKEKISQAEVDTTTRPPVGVGSGIGEKLALSAENRESVALGLPPQE